MLKGIDLYDTGHWYAKRWSFVDYLWRLQLLHTWVGYSRRCRDTLHPFVPGGDPYAALHSNSILRRWQLCAICHPVIWARPCWIWIPLRSRSLKLAMMRLNVRRKLRTLLSQVPRTMMHLIMRRKLRTMLSLVPWTMMHLIIRRWLKLRRAT